MKKTDKILKEIGISRVALNEGKNILKGLWKMVTLVKVM